MEDMISALGSSVATLRQSLVFRDCADALAADPALLCGVDAGLDDVDQRVQQLAAMLEEEHRLVQQARLLAEKVSQQAQRAKAVQGHMPARLPGAQCLGDISNAGTKPVASKQQAAKNEFTVRIPYVRKDEFDNVPSSTRGRVTCEQVNACIDAIHTALTAKHKILTAPRASLGEPQMKKLVQFREQESDETVGSFFFVEDDLKTLAQMKLDATSKTCLLVLRSLKRLRDCRSGSILRHVLCC